MSIFEKWKQGFQWTKFQDDIEEPPWDYYFLKNLIESEYPKYLTKIFKYRTGEKLPLKYDFKNRNWIIDKKRCKTFNQKMQWIKLYGVMDLMRYCTDKIKVRDYVFSLIGKEYLKPVLQICDNFDEIDFDKLPDSFVIKCNHGCKWHYIIKDKYAFLQNKQLLDVVKRNITGWLEQEYWCWGGFEMQYKKIEPKILIEPLFRENINEDYQKIQVYCFQGMPKITIKIYNTQEISIYDDKLNIIEDIFDTDTQKRYIEADKNIKLAVNLSENIAKEFKFVRIDWFLYKNNLYFEEFTFTPHSGFYAFKNNLKLGNWINLERN